MDGRDEVAPSARALDTLRLRSVIVAALGLGGCGARVVDSDGASGATDLPTTTSDSDGGPRGPWACAAPEPIVIDSRATGFLECADEGAIYREEVVPGPWKQSPSAYRCYGEGYGSCAYDEECVDEPGGKCHATGLVCSCVYPRECIDDASCDDRACSALDGACIPSACRSSADCDDGWACGYSVDAQRCDNEAFSPTGALRCHGPMDTCAADIDCPDPDEFCIFVDVAWRCSTREECSVYGRPFTVGGEARVATSREGLSWHTEVPLAPSPVDEHARALLSEHWLAQAQMEHASIAAFARHIMQLLALGAPPALVAEAGVAMDDEVRHARLAYTLASHYAGRALEPGPLACGDVAIDVDFATLAELVFTEGCVAETAAALEATRAAEAAGPELRETLEAIAADEVRHAAHAWKVLRWALSRDPSRARAAVEARLDAMESSLAAPKAEVPSELDALLARHGRPSAADSRRAQYDARVGIIVPIARSVLNARV